MDSIILEQVKKIVRAYIKEQLSQVGDNKTVAGVKRTSQPKQQQRDSIANMMSQLELAIADGNKNKLERSKKNPEFKKTIADIGQLIGELQGLLSA